MTWITPFINPTGHSRTPHSIDSRHVSSLALPNLPSQQRTVMTPLRPSKSRTRLRSLSNASKKLIAKLQGRSHQHEAPPPVPALPVSLPLHGGILPSRGHTPPPPYSMPSLYANHSRTSSSSSNRRPLRERCNFQLTVATSNKEKRAFVEDLKDQLQTLASLRSTGPRFSLLSPIHVSFPGSGMTRDSSLSHLHEVLPYLSVGFCDSKASIPFKRFTHVIKLIYLGDEDLRNTNGQPWKEGHAQHVTDPSNKNCQVLTLAVPRPASSTSVIGRGRAQARELFGQTEGKTTRLTADQLIYTRDLLSLALPYYAEAHPEVVFGQGMEEEESRSADRVRVLICAPRECSFGSDGEDENEQCVIRDEEAAAADVVSIATCYLAYATGMPVEEMIRHFDDDPNVPSVWKGAIDDFGGLEFVSDVSMKESAVFPCGN